MKCEGEGGNWSAGRSWSSSHPVHRPRRCTPPSPLLVVGEPDHSTTENAMEAATVKEAASVDEPLPAAGDEAME